MQVLQAMQRRMARPSLTLRGTLGTYDQADAGVTAFLRERLEAHRENPVCASCHGDEGVSATPDLPSLAGQSAAAIYKQLHDYRSGARVHPLMTPVAQQLVLPDLANVAVYYGRFAEPYGGLGARGRPAGPLPLAAPGGPRLAAELERHVLAPVGLVREEPGRDLAPQLDGHLHPAARGRVERQLAYLDAHPEVALVDELAHTNVPGSGHEKRWEDIEELLDAGEARTIPVGGAAA